MDVIENILSRLPVKSLLRFQCVSKNWYDLIWSPEFCKLHLSRCQKSCNSISTRCLFSTTTREIEDKNKYNASFHMVDFRAVIEHHGDHQKPKLISLAEPQDPRLVPAGSCNGLVCLRSKDWRHWALYNPTTRAYTKLPNVEETRIEELYIITAGFGYDCIGDDYKVVIFSQLDRRQFRKGMNVMVYSCKNKEWKDFVDPCVSPLVLLPTIAHSRCVFLNNALHLLANDYEPIIACFDLHHERLSRIALPNVRDYYGDCLIVLDGVLHLVMGVPELEKCDTFYLWRMNEYGCSDSWVKLRLFDNGPLLDIISDPCPTTILYTERGEVRMHYKCEIDNFVYWHDYSTAVPPNSTVEAVSSKAKRCCLHDYETNKLVGCVRYLETLVNPCH